jgi:heat shock protein HspQ
VERARFGIGELIHHRRFDYRGVIVDVDASFQGSEAWYEQVARSRPPKDAPWYHVLPHDASHTTYVAERNLEPDPSGEPVHHPLLEHFFSGFRDGRYIPEHGADA